ncbi:MAG: ATP-binding cassette domain-containing protein, partial [Mailhella sp.]|nr:ATP-binding cassette domain-containing protein [Mailhella sp.]
MANDNQPDKVIYSMHRVTKRHGQREVLKDISLGYFYGAKIGVLGLNGAGKSSLLKIMAGVDKAFDGDIVVAPGYSIGYLEQEPLVDETRTVREVVEEVAVVGNGDDSVGEVLQVAFQPGHGLGVEVVGGFVEQEDVG